MRAGCYYQDKDYKYETVPDNFADHFVQLFGTAKIDGSLSKLSRIQYNAKNNKISPEKLLEVTEQILIRLIETYQRIIEFDMMEFNKLKDPLHYKDSDEYFSLFFSGFVECSRLS